MSYLVTAATVMVAMYCLSLLGSFGGLIGTFIFAFSSSAAAVLLVDFKVPN